jgi:hypothetical protein
VVDENGDTLEAVEPLYHYTWRGFEQAEKDMRELIDPLPYQLYLDRDCDFVTHRDPEDDESNWIHPCNHCNEYIHEVNGIWISWGEDDPICSENDNDGHSPNYMSESEWVGGDNWTVINPREELMHVETYKQLL